MTPETGEPTSTIISRQPTRVTGRDIAVAILDAGGIQELRRAWDGSAEARLELPVADRVLMLELAMTRLLRIEVLHEGDGR
jgi:hypothetical protein